jgi:glutamine cyclotransferase
MEDQPENIRTNKGLVRVYFTMFWIALSTIILSIISSEHKESITLFKQYQTTDFQLVSPNQQFEILSKLPIGEPRFVEGLEFISEYELLMSSGEYGSSYVDLIDITELPLMPK